VRRTTVFLAPVVELTAATSMVPLRALLRVSEHRVLILKVPNSIYPQPGRTVRINTAVAAGMYSPGIREL